jgi:hypothetical protein
LEYKNTRDVAFMIRIEPEMYNMARTKTKAQKISWHNLREKDVVIRPPHLMARTKTQK